MAVKKLIYTSLLFYLKAIKNQKIIKKLTYLKNKIINFQRQDEKSPTPMESAPNFRPAVCGICWSSGVPRGGNRRPGNPSPIVALDLSRPGRRRLADLPTWSWMTNGIPARAFSSGHSSGVASTFRRIIEDSASNRASATLRLFPSPSNCPKVSFGVIARHHLPPVNPPSQWKQRGTVECPYFSLPKQ